MNPFVSGIVKVATHPGMHTALGVANVTLTSINLKKTCDVEATVKSGNSKMLEAVKGMNLANLGKDLTEAIGEDIDDIYEKLDTASASLTNCENSTKRIEDFLMAAGSGQQTAPPPTAPPAQNDAPPAWAQKLIADVEALKNAPGQNQQPTPPPTTPPVTPPPTQNQQPATDPKLLEVLSKLSSQLDEQKVRDEEAKESMKLLNEQIATLKKK